MRRDGAETRRSRPAELRFRLTLAYQGTAYEGWQVQRVGLGVQQKVEEALQRLFQVPVRIHSSSRTDTGVHARGMVAHFDLARSRFRMPLRKLALALNAHLPEDIRVVSAARASAGFHARFDARGKEYRYFVHNHRAMDPLRRHSAWHCPGPLDLSAMRQAAGHLVGCHDFRSFAANRHYVTENTVRTLAQCSITKRDDLITFVLRGDGFLYKMCRAVVGTLVQVGQGRIGPDEVKRILEKQDRRVAGMTAPAHGLVLWKVFYPRSSARRLGHRGPAASQVCESA